MTKRNVRNRRHGTNEMAGDASTLRRKGRGSPTIDAAENEEYTMIDLVRSVERLHYCKSGERKDSVLWADVKKYYKKSTGCVLTTEVFNKLAGVSGMGRKDLITGPLAGLLVAEDPAALVLRFKYDATKGDPLINHRFYLEASGSKTSVHRANDTSSRLADVTNTVSPSRSETSSSLSPTCLSSISTDPDTEALSPRSASSPLSSAPLSPETREFVTANDGDLPTGEQSFLTARTSPMTSDWETSPSMSSRADTSTPESPLDRSTDQERTLNIFDISHSAADTTIGVSEVLVEMDSPAKEETMKVEEEKTTVKEEETKKEKGEEVFEEGSDKENHKESSPSAVKPLEEEKEKESLPLESPLVTKHEEDDVIDLPDAVREEVVVTTTPEEKETEEEEVVHDAIQTPVEEVKEKEEEAEPTPAPAEPVAQVEEEKKGEEEETKGEEREEETEKKGEEREEEEGVQHDLAAGDGPVPLQSSPVISEESVQHEVDAAAAEAAISSPVTTSSSDEHLLTVIERGAIVPPAAVDEEKEEEHKEEREETVQPEEKVEEMEVEVEAKMDELPIPSSTLVDAVEDATVQLQDLTTSVEEKRVKMEEEKEEEERVEEMMQVEPTIEMPPEEELKKDEELVEVVDTVVQREAALEVDAAPQSEEAVIEDTPSSTTEEPTATTMVAVAPLQEVQPVQQQPLPSPVLSHPPPSTHEPMTSDDVDMHDVLAGGPNRDVHTPSVTAPITLQPKPVSRAEPEDDTEVITSQPVVDETDAATSAAATAASPTSGETAASPDLALRRAAPAKKFPCCTIV